jgi:uncharacterized membrane protein
MAEGVLRPHQQGAAMNKKHAFLGLIFLLISWLLWAAHSVDLVGWLKRLHGF